MKLNNIFESIQGEGKYTGTPALFIRLAGCNLNCDFCDTDYSEKYELEINELVKKIKDFRGSLIVWTGGEPTLQLDEINKVIDKTKGKKHTIETNGTNLNNLKNFHWVTFSPKNEKNAIEIVSIASPLPHEIKVVTDLNVNKNLIPYATTLMPLTTFTEKDEKIKKKVWNYCKENNLKYSPRLQIDLFGNKKGV